jgi:hypothetical protein
MKLQILPNLIDNVHCFGPVIQYSTEVFECFNMIFCLCSVLSNHLTPGCDIANKFASMDSLKHILSSGYWKSSEGWVHTGPRVRAILHKDTFIQQHLGWVPPHIPSVGTCCCSTELIIPTTHFLLCRLCLTESQGKIWTSHMGRNKSIITSDKPDDHWIFGHSPVVYWRACYRTVW